MDDPVLEKVLLWQLQSDFVRIDSRRHVCLRERIRPAGIIEEVAETSQLGKWLSA